MNTALSLLVSFCLIGGSLFALIAAIGINRLPDFFTRMHAASKAGTVGSGLLLLAAGLGSGDFTVLIRALAGFVFFILTAPVSAHLLARAAHRAGVRPSDATVRDDYERDLQSKEHRQN